MDMGVSGVYGVPQYIAILILMWKSWWTIGGSCTQVSNGADVEPEVTKKKPMARLPSVA